MSEPLTTHEIEDVLSSIRRLVSEDLRPSLRQTGIPEAAAMPDAAPLRPQPPARPAGRLVLTEALRVIPPEAGGPGEANDPAPDSAADPAAALAALSARAATGGAAAEPAAEVPGAPAATSDADTRLGDELFWAAAGDPVNDLIEDDAEPDPVAPVIDFRRGHWTAETVPQVAWAQTEEDWPGDETPVTFAARPRGAVPASPLVEGKAEVVDSPADADGSAAQAHAVPPESPRSDRDAAPWPARDDPARTASETAGPGLFDGDLPGFDEEVLRDIVREIIREELAGTLGERITRNVRKLVRVEINRALTAREFE
jgi:hypothetical protein